MCPISAVVWFAILVRHNPFWNMNIHVNVMTGFGPIAIDRPPDIIDALPIDSAADVSRKGSNMDCCGPGLVDFGKPDFIEIDKHHI